VKQGRTPQAHDSRGGSGFPCTCLSHALIGVLTEQGVKVYGYLPSQGAEAGKNSGVEHQPITVPASPSGPVKSSPSVRATTGLHSSVSRWSWPVRDRADSGMPARLARPSVPCGYSILIRLRAGITRGYVLHVWLGWVWRPNALSISYDEAVARLSRIRKLARDLTSPGGGICCTSTDPIRLRGGVFEPCPYCLRSSSLSPGYRVPAAGVARWAAGRRAWRPDRQPALLGAPAGYVSD
jgi:hypothetical protein